MRGSLKSWLVLGLLVSTLGYALAEDVTLTTYYPSPRGVYDQLIVNTLTLGSPGNLHVQGSLSVGPNYVPGAAGDVLVEGNLAIKTSTPTPGAALTVGSGNLAVASGDVVVSNGNVTLNFDKGLFSLDGQEGIWVRASKDLEFVTGGITRMTLDGTGQLGIGTSNPQAALDVAGGGIRLGSITRTQWQPTTTTYQTNNYLGGTLITGTNNLGLHAFCFLQSFVETGAAAANSKCYLRQFFTGPVFTPDWLIDIANAQCIVLCSDWPSQ